MDAVYNRMLSPDRRIYMRVADLHDGISIGYRSYVSIIKELSGTERSE